MQHITVDQLAAEFLSDRRPEVSAIYHDVLRVRLRDFLADSAVRQPEDVTPACISAWLKRRRDSFGVTRAHRDYGILRTWLRWATRERGYFAVNPIERVKAPKEAVRPPIRFLSRPEADRLLAACAQPVVGGHGSSNPRPARYALCP